MFDFVWNIPHKCVYPLLRVEGMYETELHAEVCSMAAK